MTQGAAEDLWHLSIDDLFVTPVETPPLEGPGPFVINLSASTAPIGIPATGLSGFEKLKLYQLSRKEDGRDRFRLRLGFFDTPAAANEALAALRELYPSAFATNATEDDQRFNPARPRPPKAEPVVAPAAQNLPGHAHARSPVRSDAGRRGKKKDVRRDHAAHSRGTEGHGAHRNKPAPRHGAVHGAVKSALHAAQQVAVKEESIDVESILLAALAPATPGKPQLSPSKPEPTPSKPHAHNNARHTAKPNGSKHSRPHSKPSEPKHHGSRPVAKLSAPAPAALEPPVASPAPRQPGVAANPEIPTPTPSLPVETLQPTKSPTPLASVPAIEKAAPPVQSSVPERIEAPPDVDNEANIVTHPRLDEANIVTHPRLDDVPAASSEVPDADIPIDLHFIDRIFDDDTPTIEALALEPSGKSPASGQEHKEIVEPIAAQAEVPKEVAPEPKAIAKRSSTESDTSAISAHDIIALLTQPIPTLRAIQNRLSPRPAPALVPETAVAIPTPAAPSAQATATTSDVDREPLAPTTQEQEVEAEPLRAVATIAIEDQIPTLTQVAGADLPPAARAPMEAEEVPTPALPADTMGQVESSVGAIAAGIESELELLLPAEVPIVDEAPASSAESGIKVEEAPSAPPIELELQLVPDAQSVPVLSDDFEEVIVAQVIPSRRESPPSARPHTDAPAEASAPQPAPMPRAPASVPAAGLPADSIFKVKNRPAQTRTAAPVAPAKPSIKRPVVVFDAPIEDMDSTQTLRALTPLELNDDTQSKWFAVQLALSEDPVKVESLPHIDIFDEYRLYSISGIDQAKFLHSLRLGFFSAESSAQAVAGYLRASFADAVVKRVSIAEHERFAERKANPEKKREPEATVERAPEAVSIGAKHPSASSRTQPSRANGSTQKATHKPRGPIDSSPTGRHKTLGEELYNEARQVALSQSAIRRIPKNSSLWSRLFGPDKDK